MRTLTEAMVRRVQADRRLAEGFARVVGVWREHGLKDHVVQNAEVFAPVFFCQAFEFSGEPEPFK